MPFESSLYDLSRFLFQDLFPLLSVMLMISQSYSGDFNHDDVSRFEA